MVYTRSDKVDVKTVHSILERYKHRIDKGLTTRFHKQMVIDLLDAIGNEVEKNVGWDKVFTPPIEK